MKSLLTQGLNIQALQVNANQLTDADVAAIKDAGLRLVHRPTTKLWDESNVISLDDLRVMSAHTSPEAA
jgi:hypothetical protein